MAKIIQKLEELINGIQKTYPEEEEPEHLTPEDHRKVRFVVNTLLVTSAAFSAGWGVYTKYIPMKIVWYSLSGSLAALYVIPKIYDHYKMKEQCKDCRHEKRNVEKLFKESGVEYGQSIGPCTLFKPKQMMLNCFQHKKYEEK